MDKKNVREFIKTHKKEIAIAAIATVVGSVAFVITRKTPKFAKETIKSVTTKVMPTDIPKPELEFGTLTDLWVDDLGVINAIVNDITVADLGKFGEQLTKIDGVENNTVVTAVMGFINNPET